MSKELPIIKDEYAEILSEFGKVYIFQNIDKDNTKIGNITKFKYTDNSGHLRTIKLKRIQRHKIDNYNFLMAMINDTNKKFMSKEMYNLKKKKKDGIISYLKKHNLYLVLIEKVE